MPSGIKWIKDSVAAVDPVWNQVTTKSNGKIPYDFFSTDPGITNVTGKSRGITHDTLGQGNANSIYDFEGAQRHGKLFKNSLKGGKGIYTDTYTKHKCGGAPKRSVYYPSITQGKQGTRDKLQLNYFTASKELYDIPYFPPRLLEIYNERNIPINLNVRVKGVDIR